MNYKEVTRIEDLKIGETYACVWKTHKYPSRTKNLDYLNVRSISKKTKSGCLVRTGGGNRCFDKLRWFGPIPSTIHDIETLQEFAGSNDTIH